MKYSLPKKIIYSIIVAVLLVGLVLTAFFGLNGKGYGSTYDIDLGLDLAGGVSITYQIKEDNFTSQDVEDTIYKLQKRVEGKSTESQVYKEGDNRITVEIPGVTDANEILKELGTPGSLEFLDSTGYTAFSQGNDYTPLLTGSDVKLHRLTQILIVRKILLMECSLHLQMRDQLSSTMQHQLISVKEYILYMMEKL